MYSKDIKFYFDKSEIDISKKVMSSKVISRVVTSFKKVVWAIISTMGRFIF